MGHFLIIQIHDSSKSFPYKSSGPTSSSTLWAVDLKNNTVDPAIHMEDFYFHEECTFTKLGENQIIKFGGKQGVHQITIESFKRILDLSIVS